MHLFIFAEQNNLLANLPSEPIGYNCPRINPFVTNSITSFPATGSHHSEHNDLETPIIESKAIDEKDRFNILTADVSSTKVNQTNFALENLLPGNQTLR